MRRYPDRRPQYRQGRQRLPRKKKQTSVTQLLLMAGAIGVVGWSAAPELASTWRLTTQSPDEIAQNERAAYYPNCDAARAAGAAPLYAGSPGYREEMDGDLDGIACEPYRY